MMPHMTMPLPLDKIRTSTQVRTTIDQRLVREYAEVMLHGTRFPSITVFFDGTEYHLADGHHRVLARQLAGYHDIEADVYSGRQEDALWYALGANRANGLRLTRADTRHAIQLALQMWPTRPQREIAHQVGCSQQFVSQVATRGHARERGQFAKLSAEKAAAIETELRKGLSTREVASRLHASVHTVARVREHHQIPTVKLTTQQVAVRERYSRMRQMAAAGYSSRQIAKQVGMTFASARSAMKIQGIVVPADAITGRTKRHNANRMVEQIVADAETLFEGADLIYFDTLQTQELPTWIRILEQSRERLGAFIRRLREEQQHVQAAQSQAVQDSSGADRADASPARAADAAGISVVAREQDRRRA
jgi:transposase